MNTRQLLLSLVLGTVFWLLAALFVRHFGTHFFAGQTPRLLGLYAATLPLSCLFMLTARWLGKLTPPALYDSAVVMTATATVLDGVALAFLQPLYGDTPAIVLRGAAWILWGVGCGLALSYVLKTSWQPAPPNPVTAPAVTAG